MTLERDIALIDELRSNSSELSIVEFKHNNSDPKLIARLCSALSNSARIEQQNCAFILWGIDNNDHSVIGTSFDPESQTVGNEVFQLWLAKRLSPSIAFAFRSVTHPDGKVVLLEIPAATTAPVAFDSIQYIRIGSATSILTDYPQESKCSTSDRSY